MLSTTKLCHARSLIKIIITNFAVGLNERGNFRGFNTMLCKAIKKLQEHQIADMAQLVEQRIRNAWVTSSSLVIGSFPAKRE